MLGNGRCECFCFDGVTRLGHIRGKMRKKVWITAGDIVLVGKRDFQDEKVDIIHKYSADEARNLKQYGELPETARINETAVDMAMTADDEDNDIGIDFDGTCAQRERTLGPSNLSREDSRRGCLRVFVLCPFSSSLYACSCVRIPQISSFHEFSAIDIETESIYESGSPFFQTKHTYKTLTQYKKWISENKVSGGTQRS